MYVVATAGHVDHGKSTLVRLLTGMEPDRWAEERRRGMTIDLGFAWTTLPSGATVAYVDVPGHERSVGNMLAGVGPVPVVMFVVAADEGWMPQSTEHLAALDAFGVQHGLLVVTRCDLADPTPARAQALGQLRHTSLGTVECVCVTGTTGAGLDQLRQALDRVVASLPQPDRDAPVRLWVDRAFTIRGAGTVITGTLGAGTLHAGDELLLTPGDRRVRVRGLQSLQKPCDTLSAVARVAVNIAHLPLTDVRRGSALLTPGAWQITERVDIRTVDELTAQVLVHIGAAAVTARVRPFDAHHARLTLARPLPLHIGDRLLFRDPGSRRIIAATALDIRPPALTGRGAVAQRGKELAGMTTAPDPAGELRRRRLMTVEELRAMGCPKPPGVVPVAGRWLLDPAHAERLRSQLAAEAAAYIAQHPIEPGPSLEHLRQRLALPDRSIIEALCTPPLEIRHGLVVRPDVANTLPADVTAAITAVRRSLAGAAFAVPDRTQLAELGLDHARLAAAVRAGALLRIADRVYLLPDALEIAKRELSRIPQPFTVSEARTALGTTRRVAVPLLELFDQRGDTERLDDVHRRLV